MGLARLTAKGFRVPPGFCVTTQVYRDTLQAGGLNSLDRWNRARRTPEAQREPLLARLEAELAKIPPRNAYYPGAEARYASLTKDAEHVTRIGDAGPGQLPWTLITELDPRSSAPQWPPRGGRARVTQVRGRGPRAHR